MTRVMNRTNAPTTYKLVPIECSNRIACAGDSGRRWDFSGEDRIKSVVYITRGLIEILCQMAARAEPESISVALDVTPAEEWVESETVEEDTLVYTHFYMPDSAHAISAIFGVDLSTPSGRTRGRFISHPMGERSLSLSDDLHGIVFVAIPPWEESSVACFDRAGRKLAMNILDAAPPGETLDDHSR